MGLQFAVTLVVAALAGVWVDRTLGSSPAFLIVGVFGGAGGSMYLMFRRLKRRGAGPNDG